MRKSVKQISFHSPLKYDYKKSCSV